MKTLKFFLLFSILFVACSNHKYEEENNSIIKVYRADPDGGTILFEYSSGDTIKLSPYTNIGLLIDTEEGNIHIGYSDKLEVKEGLFNNLYTLNALAYKDEPAILTITQQHTENYELFILYVDILSYILEYKVLEYTTIIEVDNSSIYKEIENDIESHFQELYPYTYRLDYQTYTTPGDGYFEVRSDNSQSAYELIYSGTFKEKVTDEQMFLLLSNGNTTSQFTYEEIDKNNIVHLTYDLTEKYSDKYPEISLLVSCTFICYLTQTIQS